MNNTSPNILKNSIFSFLLIAVLIISCSALIGYYLKQQEYMLRASGVSYQQRILFERIGDQLNLLLNQNVNSDRVLQKLQSDIVFNAKLINANQLELENMLLRQNQFFYRFSKYIKFDLLSIDFIKFKYDFMKVEQYWVKFNRMIQNIHTFNVDTKNAVKYMDPVDILLSHNGLLSSSMAELNLRVYEASLRQNKRIKTLYAVILLFVLSGIWFVWYLTLRPLLKQITRHNSELEHQANHDPMTQLLNRAAFNKKMDSLGYEGEPSSLILIDVDDFKDINDNLGHKTGDDVLIGIANAMQFSPLKTESAYRIGGDEFALIIDAVSDRNQLSARLDSFINTISLPLLIDGKEILVSCSLGIATGVVAEEVFSAADISLYRAKESGKGCYQMFDDISESVAHLLHVESTLYTAVKEKQFIAHYQPIVNLYSGQVDTLEALARWDHPTRGVLLPKEWIADAERLGLLSEITLQIMDTVENDYHAWKREGIAVNTIYVNLTEKLLLNGDALTKLKAMLNRSAPDLPWLGVEITESIVLDRAINKIEEQLSLMHQAGIKIALDDFGTGFANLSHLSKITFDRLKIDRSFTSKIIDDPGMRLIVKSLIDLSFGLKKQVICEGTETLEIKQVLVELGCKYSQGFLHSKGLSFEQYCASTLTDKFSL